MTLLCNLLHQRPGKVGFLQVASPILPETPVSHAQVISWNSRRDMVGNMHINVVTKKLYPTGIGAVNRSRKLGLSFVPLLNWTEWDIWIRVMNQCKCAHPEMID